MAGEARHDMDEFVRLANTNEEYPVEVDTEIANKNPTKYLNTVDPKFNSKHFARAEAVCCASTILILFSLLCIWILFEFKEAPFTSDK